MILKNITFAELLELNDDEAFPYIFAFQHGTTLVKPVNHFGLKDVQTYTFGQVKDAIYNIERGLTMADVPDFISLFTGAEPNSYKAIGVVEVLQAFAYLKKGLEQIIEAEKQMLVRPVTSKDITAGIDRFTQFGVYPQIEEYALKWGQTIEWARAQPYSDAFLSMSYSKAKQDFQEAYAKLK